MNNVNIEIDAHNRTFRVNGTDIAGMLDPKYSVDITSGEPARVTVTFLADTLVYQPATHVEIMTASHADHEHKVNGYGKAVRCIKR